MKFKQCLLTIKAHDDAKLTIDHFISTEGLDRGNDIMKSAGMKINGEVVVLFQHGLDPVKGYEPIAKPIKFTTGTNEKGDKGIIAVTQFPDDDEGKRLYNRVKNGFLKNWSIGYDVIEAEIGKKGERIVTEWELFEYSPVAISMNADATNMSGEKEMKELQYKFFVKKTESTKAGRPNTFLTTDTPASSDADDSDVKAIIPFHPYPLAEKDEKWSALDQIKEAEVDDLLKMCTWHDKENKENKSAYKLLHHNADETKTVLDGVKAAMGSLMGAKGGVDIPDDDRKDAHIHLAKHYKEFGLDAPEFKTVEFSFKEKLFTDEAIEHLVEGTAKKSIQEDSKLDIAWSAMCMVMDYLFYELAKTAAAEKEVKKVLKDFNDTIYPYALAFTEALAERMGPESKSEMEIITDRISEFFKQAESLTSVKSGSGDPAPQPEDATVVIPESSPAKQKGIRLVAVKSRAVPKTLGFSKADVMSAIKEASAATRKESLDKLKGRLD